MPAPNRKTLLHPALPTFPRSEDQTNTYGAQIQLIGLEAKDIQLHGVANVNRSMCMCFLGASGSGHEEPVPMHVLRVGTGLRSSDRRCADSLDTRAIRHAEVCRFLRAGPECVKLNLLCQDSTLSMMPDCAVVSRCGTNEFRSPRHGTAESSLEGWLCGDRPTRHGGTSWEELRNSEVSHPQMRLMLDRDDLKYHLA